MRVILTVLDLETRGGECVATVERHRGERSEIARRSKPEHTRSPARRKGAESIQNHIEWCCAVRDWCHRFESVIDSRLLNRPKEMNSQMERRWTRPANVFNARPELSL